MGVFSFAEIRWRTDANFHSSTLMFLFLDLIFGIFLYPKITEQAIGRDVLHSVWAKQQGTLQKS